MTPTLTTKSLELRINSVDDAKAIVYNSSRIQKDAEAKGFDSFQFLIAKEVRSEVEPIIRGIFKKTFTQTVIPQTGNLFYSVPHFRPTPQKIVIKNTVVPRGTSGEVKIPKKRGPKPKQPQAEVSA